MHGVCCKPTVAARDCTDVGRPMSSRACSKKEHSADRQQVDKFCTFGPASQGMGGGGGGGGEVGSGVGREGRKVVTWGIVTGPESLKHL